MVLKSPCPQCGASGAATDHGQGSHRIACRGAKTSFHDSFFFARLESIVCRRCAIWTR